MQGIFYAHMSSFWFFEVLVICQDNGMFESKQKSHKLIVFHVSKYVMVKVCLHLIL